MYHFTAVQTVLGVAGLFTSGLGIGATFAVLVMHDERRALRRERDLIDRWDQDTSTDLMGRLADPEPEPDPPVEVIVPTVADISIVDNRPWALDRVLSAAVLMGALMERNQQGPARHGRHSGEHMPAGHELLLTLLMARQRRVVEAEVA